MRQNVFPRSKCALDDLALGHRRDADVYDSNRVIGQKLIERSVRPRQRPGFRERGRPLRIDVIDTAHVESGLPVRRRVRIGDDRAGADVRDRQAVLDGDTQIAGVRNLDQPLDH